MKLLSPTQHKRLNEVIGFLLLSLGLVVLLSLVSYHTQDPSWDTAAESQPLNLIGYPGSYASDLLFQAFGATAFLFPLLMFLLAWKWIRSEGMESGIAKTIGAVILTMGASAGLAFLPWRLFGGAIRMGGLSGYLLARYLLGALNLAGAIVAILTSVLVAVYLVSSFTLEKGMEWMAGPRAWYRRRVGAWRAWRAEAHARALEKARERDRQRRETKQLKARKPKSARVIADLEPAVEAAADSPPWESAERPAPVMEEEPAPEPAAEEEEIPICQVEDLPPVPPPMPVPVAAAQTAQEPAFRAVFSLPSTELLNEAPGRSAYDEQELKDTAVKIKSKFEEFNVLGNVVQINPGPVVTTFRIQARSRHQVQPHHESHGRPVSRSASRIDPHRAHPGQADRRHRSPQHQARSHRAATDAGERRVHDLRVAPHHSARQGHQRADPHGRRSRYHAAPADRRFHRRRQERHDQLA